MTAIFRTSILVVAICAFAGAMAVPQDRNPVPKDKSDDPTYGYEESNPIKVGGSPENEIRIFESPRGPDGQNVKFERLGSCCISSTPNALVGDAALLDRYKATYRGLKEPIILYLNMYDYEQPKVPIGFSKAKPMDVGKLHEFATKYTASWCSQDAASVAGFFAKGGALKINDEAPSVGRTAITAVEQGFMTAFPDIVVTMDGVSVEGDHVVYRWTLTGTNTGPGGAGKAVRISGYEEWTIGADGLIAESKGHFDEAEYNRQLQVGFDGR